MDTTMYLKPAVDAIVAATVAGKHPLLISKDPGWGKTEVMDYIRLNIAGDLSYFLRIHPGVPTAKIEGAYDPEEILNHGRLVKRTEDTAYDPKNRIVLLDEISRATDAHFDLFLDILDRKDVAVPPIVYSTANFMVQNERSRPMRDRIAVWIWLAPVMEDVRVWANAMRPGGMIDLSWAHLPTLQELDEVASWSPTDTSHEVVVSFIEALGSEAMAEGFIVNPRRIRQWYDILFKYSAWLEETPDFSQVPDKAKAVMQYAWPTPTYKEFVEWKKIANALANIIRTAVLNTLNDARTMFEQELKNPNGLSKGDLVLSLGQRSAVFQSNLEKVGGDDPFVEKGKEILALLFEAAATGGSMDKVYEESVAEVMRS